MSPIERAVRWGGDALGEPVKIVQRYEQATTATIVRVAGERQGAVVKLSDIPGILDETPDLVIHEAAVLGLLGDVDAIPIARVLAADAEGEHCGVPALLLTVLPG